LHGYCISYMRRTPTKFIAFLFLLIFIEKAGLRLFIHDALHTSSATSAKSEKAGDATVSKLGCDCIDDFFLPLTTTEVFSVDLPVTSYIVTYPVYYKGFIPPFSLRAGQLRGPPSA